VAAGAKPPVRAARIVLPRPACATAASPPSSPGASASSDTASMIRRRSGIRKENRV